MKFKMLVIPMLLAAASLAGANPKFTKISTSVDQVTGDVTVSFQESGLGGGDTFTYQVTGSAEITSACFNKSGKIANDSKKTSVTGTVAASGTFTSAKNGSVKGAVVVEAPTPANLDCPGGQTERVVAVKYWNLMLTSSSGGSAGIPDVNVTFYQVP